MKLTDENGNEYEFEGIKSIDANLGHLTPITPEPETWQVPNGDWCLGSFNAAYSDAEIEDKKVGNTYANALFDEIEKEGDK